MPLTLLGLAARYGPRLGPYAGLADLPDAIRYGLNQLGLTPAAATTIVDADVAAVPAGDHNQLDDLVIYRCYETILLNLADDLLREAGVAESADKLRPVFQKLLDRLAAKLKDQYGVGLPTPTAGAIALDFAARGDDTLDGYGS